MKFENIGFTPAHKDAEVVVLVENMKRSRLNVLE
jgi:hypothetical protein